MSKTCKSCSAIIPSGRNYCDAHYHEALEKYNEAINKYNQKLEKFNQDTKTWDSLTSVQRAKKDAEAEIAALRIIITIFSQQLNLTSPYANVFKEIKNVKSQIRIHLFRSCSNLFF